MGERRLAIGNFKNGKNLEEQGSRDAEEGRIDG